MKKHSPLSEQVVVITGASSGIGLVTANLAARAGARVVLAARNAHDLDRAVDGILKAGGDAIAVPTDVSDEAQVTALARTAVQRYGRIDTWVNNAAVSMYGKIVELDTADMRRQMDINFWGTVYGCRAAVAHMKEGTILNVASALADRAIPLQGVYCAAKHAIKAFTDTLRMELERDGFPITVTLLKPGSIDTPFFQKAKTLLAVEPQPVPPVYAPEIVAHAILNCAVHPHREVAVTGMAKLLGVAQTLAPRITDRYMERRTIEDQSTNELLAPGRRHNLYHPLPSDGGERGLTYYGRVKSTSLYTSLALRPKLALGMALAALALWIGRRRLLAA
jgi:NAD(P)-dependent dehydrogenase (short-subunit alcohol dehydrogenase family)